MASGNYEVEVSVMRADGDFDDVFVTGKVIVEGPPGARCAFVEGPLEVWDNEAGKWVAPIGIPEEDLAKAADALCDEALEDG